MHAVKTHFSKQIGRYKHLARRVNRLLKDGSFQLLSQLEQRSLLAKLKARLKRIGHLMPSGQLKGALAGIALLLGAAFNQVEAQSFAPGIGSPFGIEPGTTTGYSSFADIDGDGDLDLLLNTYDANTYELTFAFYENIGTPQSPSFTADNYTLNPFGIEPVNGSQPILKDFDNDGDLDLMSGALYYGGGFNYQENIGTATSPNYGPLEFNPFGLNSNQYIDFATAADMDGDGDLDVFGGGYGGDLTYYENIGTPSAPAFAAPQTNPFGIATGTLYVAVPHLCDLDGDGDQDMLVFNYNYYSPSEIAFLENTGTSTAPSFEAPVSNPFGINMNGFDVAIPSCADMDADGDTDVFINDFYGSNIVFYENLNINLEQPPTSADNTVNMDEDGTYIFQPDDFTFMDGNLSDQLEAVQITALPSAGELQIGSTPVNVNDVVLVANLGNLNYKPGLNEFGSNYASFGFKVYDGSLYSTDANTITFNVSPVNDAPASQDAEVNASNDFDYVFEAADFPYSDVEGDAFAAVTITSLPDKGTLKLNGVAVVVNQNIAVANLPNLSYTSLAGALGTPYTSFQFKVGDGASFSPNTIMRINVAETSATTDGRLQVQLRLSPNPVAEVLNFSAVSSEVIENPTVQILDMNGRLVLSKLINNHSQQFDCALDLGTLAAGNYLVKIEAKGTSSTVRFIKS